MDHCFPYVSLKINKQSKRSSTWFSFGLWNTDTGLTRILFKFQVWESLLNGKCDSPGFQHFLFYFVFIWGWSGPMLRIVTSCSCRCECSSMAFGHDDVGSFSWFSSYPGKTLWIQHWLKLSEPQLRAHVPSRTIKTVLHQSSWQIYSLSERLVYDWVWRMLCSTA